MMSFARGGILWACCLLAGCGTSNPPPVALPTVESESILLPASPRLLFELTVSGEQRRDRIAVTATITNSSRETVAVDREFSLGVVWLVKDETTGTAIVPKYLGTAPKPESGEAQKRFVILQPGKSVSKEIELTGQVKTTLEGHGTFAENGGASYHKGIFYERLTQFKIPDTCKQLAIAFASGESDFLASGAMIDWFGEETRALSLWHGRGRSNVLKLSLR